MVRSRRNSLVQAIAVQPTALEPPQNALLNDSYLMENLQKLSLAINGSQGAGVVPLAVEKGDSEPESVSATPAHPDKYKQYTDYLAQIDDNLVGYNKILEQTNKINAQLEESLDHFNRISEEAADFVDSTKSLYDSQKELSVITEALPPYLAYFDNLDPIIRRLNHANSPNYVRRESFKTMLTNIDKSLIFLDEHPDLKDAEVYRIKFKQCLIRACDLISRYLGNNLKIVQNEINQKNIMANKNTRDALLYNKFASIAEDFKLYSSELVTRVLDDDFKRYHDELKSILNDVMDQYFQIRYKFLNQIVWLQMDDTIIKDKKFDLLHFIQDNKSYFQQLCNREYKLFIEFFPENSLCKGKINRWFIRLCDPLYITVGTRCGRESNIDVLCDSLMLFEPFYQFEEDSEEYQKQFSEVQFDKVFKPVLTRIQNRLIDTVNHYIDSEITKYTPAVDDFMISNKKLKLRDDEEFVKTYIGNFQEIGGDNTESDSTTNVVSSYYTPLIKGLALLFKIYELVNPMIFDRLAHHTVHSCVVSLKGAFTNVLAKEPSETSMIQDLDQRLYYLKNLLLLRDEIQDFNIKYTLNSRSLDFSGVGTVFKSYRSGESSLFSLAKELVPRVVNNMTDARVELFQELRGCVRDLTDKVVADIMGESLDAFDGAHMSGLSERITQQVETSFPRVFTQVCDVIKDQEISHNLLKAIEQGCVEKYSAYYETVVQMEEDGKVAPGDVSQLIPPEVVGETFALALSKILGE